MLPDAVIAHMQLDIHMCTLGVSEIPDARLLLPLDLVQSLFCLLLSLKSTDFL